MRQQFVRIGFEPAAAMSPAEFGNLMRAEVAKWGKVIREARIQPE